MEKSNNSPILQESELLKILLTQDYTKTIDNLRIQRLMGINRTDGKATMETIPSKADRSMFSCERYQFFLNAPFEISNMCCKYIKKNPAHNYSKKTGRHPITAQMASESRLRTQVWLNNGCNAFNSKNPVSNPMSFWTEEDVLAYIRAYHDEMIKWRNEEFFKKYGYKPEESENPFTINSPIASVYGKIVTDDEETGQLSLADLLGTEIFDLNSPCLHTTGMKRTGCFACGYGQHHEKEKDSRLKSIIDFSNPKMADWILRGGKFYKDGLWKPYQGLGMAFVYEWCNQHGNLKFWYPDREKYLKQLPDECWKYLEK